MSLKPDIVKKINKTNCSRIQIADSLGFIRQLKQSQNIFRKPEKYFSFLWSSSYPQKLGWKLGGHGPVALSPPFAKALFLPLPSVKSLQLSFNLALFELLP